MTKTWLDWSDMNDWIGYQWLAQTYQLQPVQAFRVRSQIGTQRKSVTQHAERQETFTPNVRPQSNLTAHLTFALKHEGMHLEFLARLFAVLPISVIEEWIRNEPTGQYARRVGFLYEWLMHTPLNMPDVSGGGYVDLLNPDDYMTATTPTKNSRWRIRNNLLGTADYCPLIYRTAAVQQAAQLDIAAAIDAMQVAYGEDILMRSAVWLTNKESKASFVIEHAGDQLDRISRFAAVMELHCGQAEQPLTMPRLVELQREILGAQALHYGVRQSPVFVGEVVHFTPVVHYIAPPWQQLNAMLTGLAVCEQNSRDQSSVLRAALLSFGFVLIHPMVDGNGRLSRFLINDVLRRDGVLPAPLILPVSATITRSTRQRRHYDQVLESYSKPIMRHVAGRYRFVGMQTFADGVKSNLEFDAEKDILPVWRYPDLTEQVEYLAEVIHLTLTEEMPREAHTIQQLRQTRLALKALIEGSDYALDRIIRAVREHGQISNKLREEFPLLDQPALAAQVIEVIQQGFAVDAK